MSHPLNLTLDLYLQRMAARGEFDNLAGAGRPIEDLAEPGPTVFDKLMLEADVKPVPVLLYQQVGEIRAKLAQEQDPGRRHKLMRNLADAQTLLAIELETYRKFR